MTSIESMTMNKNRYKYNMKNLDKLSRIINETEELVIEEVAKYLLKCHEGYRDKVYHDPTGHKTIGYGHNLNAYPVNIKNFDNIKALELFNKDYERAKNKAKKLEYFDNLSKVRQEAIINMVYNMGLQNIRSFKKMAKALKEENYKLAAEEALDSKWATQVGQRANDISEMILYGTLKVVVVLNKKINGLPPDIQNEYYKNITRLLAEWDFVKFYLDNVHGAFFQISLLNY